MSNANPNSNPSTFESRQAQPLYPPTASAVASGCVSAWRGHPLRHCADHNRLPGAYPQSFAFPVRGLTGARSLLLLVIACAAGLALALPLLRLTRRRATVVAESAHPEFQQRLLTFDDREKKGDDPFLELLAADTLSVARDAQPDKPAAQQQALLPCGRGLGLRGRAGLDGHRGSRLSRLRRFPALDRAKAAAALRHQGYARRCCRSPQRDQLITAHLIGLKPEKVRLFARYQSSQGKAGWEPVAMQADGCPPTFSSSLPGFRKMSSITWRPARSLRRHYKVRVVDLPSVKQMRVTYHYPKWTGMKRSPRSTVATCVPSKARMQS